jgi:predicted GNAT family N-acyltransferase
MNRFTVTLLVAVSDETLAARLVPDDDVFWADLAVPEHDETFRFRRQRVADDGDLERLVALLRTRPKSAPVLVLSDRLVERNGTGDLVATALARRVRESLRTSSHPCGLLAVVDQPRLTRVTDIDGAIPTTVDASGARTRIVRAATALRLKAPPPPRVEIPAESSCVAPVQSEAQLARCLQLRRHVYGLLGYLPTDVADDPSGVEIDEYDGRAVHLAAEYGGELVGTARVILDLPGEVGGAIRRMLAIDSVRRSHAMWCKAIARRTTYSIRDCLKGSPFMPLPILRSTDFRTRWAQALQALSGGAELSRVIVAPRHRGRGVSRLLIQAAIDVARRTQSRLLLLECIPVHEPMYAKHGFRRLPGSFHSRDQHLDQYAVAMALPLGEENGDHPWDSGRGRRDG